MTSSSLGAVQELPNLQTLPHAEQYSEALVPTAFLDSLCLQSNGETALLNHWHVSPGVLGPEATALRLNLTK